MDVRAQVSDFNWEIDLFLRVLTRFRKNVNKADSNTLKLLGDTLVSIDDLISGADSIDDHNENSNLFAIDEGKFEIGRFITCRICCLQIPLTRDEYLNHVTSDYHNLAVIRREKSSSQKQIADVAATAPSQLSSSNGKQHDGYTKNMANNSDKSKTVDRSATWRDREPVAARKNAVNTGNDLVAQKMAPLSAAKPTGGVKPAQIPKLVDAKEPTQFTKSFVTPVTIGTSTVSQLPSKQPPKPMTASRTPLPTVQPIPLAAPPKTSPIVPPNVFDEAIFDFIASQNSIKRTESVQSVQSLQSVQMANKTMEKPMKIVSASTSAEIKPSKPYEMSLMYSNFSHLKPTVSASVPIVTKSVPTKPAQVSNNKTPQALAPNAEDLHVHKFLSQVAEWKSKPGVASSSKKPIQPSNGIKAQNNLNDAVPVMSNELNAKLKEMFEEINKLKSKAELEQIQASRQSQRTSSIVSLPATGIDDETKRQTSDTKIFRRSMDVPKHSQANFRGRSLSNSNISNAPKVDTSKGAIPKQRNTPKTNSNNDKNLPPGKQQTVLCDFFSRDLTTFLSLSMKTAGSVSQLPVHEEICTEMEKLLSTKYPKVKCHPIGSRTYGIAKDTSSLDIYLDLIDTFQQDKTAKAYVDGIVNAESLLSKNPNWCDVQCNDWTRYGLLFATHKASKIKCRMVFGTGVPVRNTELIQCMFDVQPVCRQLVVCVRLVLQEIQNPMLMRFRNGYIITHLVLFYFQNQKKIPSVQSMQVGCDRIKCGENAVGFKKPKTVQICSDRFLDILVAFFKFYAEFNFHEHIVSVFHGHAINHNIRDEPDHKLEPMQLRFKRFIYAEEWKWPESGMCVQDIFMHKRNVTLSVTRDDVAHFQAFCSDALTALQSVGASVRY